MMALNENFGMDRESRDAPVNYLKECGERLERVRLALGYPKRPAFIRDLFGNQLEESEVARRRAQLEKWESGEVLARPWFVDHLKAVFNVTQDYVFSGDKRGLTFELRNAIDEIERKNRPR